jgi:aminoglycoside/choline kinase family phosphotransferase/UTP-glucose-1-phosphate uridylyltransferase
MKAMILAAGFGTRLKPFTRHTPKPLFPIAGRPLLDRIIRNLENAGVTEIIVNTHYLHQKIEAFIERQSYTISVSTKHETEILGTGGALKNVADFWDEQPFMVVNGDILFEFDLKEIYRFHLTHPHPVTLVLYDDAEFNQVAIDGHNAIVDFAPPRSPEPDSLRRLTFTGIHVIDPEILDIIPVKRFYNIIDAYKKIISGKMTIQAFIPEKGFWKDMGSPVRYREAVVNQILGDAFAKICHHKPHGQRHRSRLQGDGSDRSWYRLHQDEYSLIMVDHGIRADAVQQEVDAFIRIGTHLAAKGVAVPKIIAADSFAGLVVVEDLGDLHLQEFVLHHRSDPALVLSRYHTVIDQLIHMAISGAAGFNPKWTWQSATYDREVVMDKECRYFVEAFLNRYMEMNVRFAGLEKEFAVLAKWACACSEIGFMHRDFQSRNIMLHKNRPFFIDFQGGRLGPLQYDLASLLMDPYVGLSKEDVSSLYDYYLERLASYGFYDVAKFRKGFQTCAVTRNLQILGAFGHLSKNKGKHNFEAYIPRALVTLIQNLENHPECHQLPGLQKIVKQAAINLKIDKL